MRFVATRSFQSASVNSVIGARRCTPALFTRMSTVPTSDSSAAMPASTAAASVTSKVETSGSVPDASRDGPRGAFGLRAIAAVHHDARARLGEAQCERAADALARSGHERGSPGQVEQCGHVQRSPCSVVEICTVSSRRSRSRPRVSGTRKVAAVVMRASVAMYTAGTSQL